MSYITYKITMDPSTFETMVMEMTVPECDDEMPIGKRRLSNEEVQSKWSPKQFIAELSKYGYKRAAVDYIDENR